MEIVQTILYVVIVIAAVLLILLTIAQSNKGSDLGLFGGSTDMVFGSQKGNFLTRFTAILATVVLAGTFLMSVLKVHVNKEEAILNKSVKTQKVKTIDQLKKESAKPKESTEQGKKATDKKVEVKKTTESKEAKKPVEKKTVTEKKENKAK